VRLALPRDLTLCEALPTTRAPLRSPEKVAPVLPRRAACAPLVLAWTPAKVASPSLAWAATALQETPDSRQPSNNQPCLVDTAARPGPRGLAAALPEPDWSLSLSLQDASTMANCSPDVIWSLVKDTSCHLLKRKVSGKSKMGKAGVHLTLEPNNLTGINSFKYSGIANAKTVGIEPTEKGIVLTTKSRKSDRIRKVSAASSHACCGSPRWHRRRS